MKHTFLNFFTAVVLLYLAAVSMLYAFPTQTEVSFIESLMGYAGIIVGIVAICIIPIDFIRSKQRRRP